MPSRRAHTKSRCTKKDADTKSDLRHGCVNCKARKVKCDETRPQCLRCVTRQTACHYSEPFRSNYQQETTCSSPTPTQISRVSTPTNPSLPYPLEFPFGRHNVDHLSPHALQEVFQSQAPSTATTFSANPIGITPPHGRRNWDMELLHHYSTTPDLFPTHSPEQLEVWRVFIPKSAFSNKYLLHGILSLSAAHLCQAIPEGQNQLQEAEEYTNLAKHHFTAGLSLFRPMLNYIDKDNAPPIVSFSIIIIILVMAMPPNIESEPMKPSAYVVKMADNLFLIYGVRQVLSQCWPHIQQSFLAVAIGTDRERGVDALGFEAEVALRYIEARIQSDISEPSLKEEYLSATKSLRDCNPSKADTIAAKENVILAWPAMISFRLFEEIKAEKPAALALFVFFGTLMHKLEALWWVTDKGKKIVHAATELLPRGWESVIVWAKMSVGLPCDYTPMTT